MIARSSGSIRAESAVELTRSEKHHEELSMLGAGGADAAVATAGFGAFFSRASEFSYRAQQLPSMTERHLDLFKVLSLPLVRQSWRFDDLLTFGGQLGQRLRRFRFGRRRWMQRRILEPEIEFVTAAVAWERRGLWLAFHAARRTGDLDVKVLGGTISGTHLEKPSAISSSLAAQRLLDCSID